MSIPTATLRDLNNAAYLAWKQARKMNDPQVEEYRLIYAASNRVMDQNATASA
ncbi:hypothetical protein [Yoonia sp.]|jgi:hypothetical protein|uniref:hypothetical protein n=1 Tax=Yoonia sp. TaxID=2212373 RepID=UPI002E08C76E|nr:hypothetical protein [Yoonia sp.]